MRVILLTSNYFPNVGGPASFVPWLAKTLDRAGHEVVIIAKTAHDSKDRVLANSNIREVVIDNRDYWFKAFSRVISKVYKYTNQATIYFANTMVFEAAFCKIFFKKKTIVKIVGDYAWEFATNRQWVQCNIDEFQHIQKVKLKYLKRLFSLALSFNDEVIVPSIYLRNMVEKWPFINGTPLRVVYNSVTVKRDALVVCRPERPYLIYVARLAPWKGVIETIEEFIEIRHTLKSEAVLTIIGEGPLESEIIRLANIHGRDKINFLGKLPRAKTLELIDCAEGMILYSDYEGLPHVVIEAMALKTPVIVKRKGGTPELFKEGYEFLVDSRAELRSSIELLLNGKYDNLLLEDNYNRFKTNFSEEEMTRKYLQIFD